MSRAQQVGEDGFRIASGELKSLLDLGLEPVAAPGSDELTLGYHVVLFYGLKLTEKVDIVAGMTAIPLDGTESFLNRAVLERAVPGIVSYNSTAVGAVLCPVPWKPALLPPGDESEPQLDFGGTFFEDARVFVELLSLALRPSSQGSRKLLHEPVSTRRTTRS